MTLIITKEELDKLTTFFKNNPEVTGLEVKIEEQHLKHAEENALVAEEACGTCGGATCICDVPAPVSIEENEVQRLRAEGNELSEFFS